jgi:hypothetical protein
VAALVASLALLAVVGTATARTPAQHVTIVSDMVVTGQGGNYGTFTSSESRLICGSGTVEDTALTWLRGPDENGYVLTVDKTFTCADGSGRLFFRLLVRGNADVERFTWAVVGGTGTYAGRFGLGVGSTLPTDGGVVNTYSGYLFH